MQIKHAKVNKINYQLFSFQCFWTLWQYQLTPENTELLYKYSHALQVRKRATQLALRMKVITGNTRIRIQKPVQI